MSLVHLGSLSALLRSLQPEYGTVVVRAAGTTTVATRPTEILIADGADAFAALDEIERSGGWWAGYLGYDLGRAVEPVRARATDDRSLPDLVFARFDTRLSVAADGRAVLYGDTTGVAADALRHAAWRSRSARGATARAPRARTWSSSADCAEYAAAQRVIHEHLNLGNCYQVNLTRRLTHRRPIDPVELFGALDAFNPAPHACLLRFGTRGPALAVVGASPELFLAIDGDRLVTRPIKGTHRDAATLVSSAKDAAEHVMIVDLARNDLGRVCVPGTIDVPELMVVEAHPGLHHFVSTVTGQRRDDATLGTIIRALFPAASITGAPKPAVMQIIEDLEPVRRGVYCGATGWIDAADRRAELAVAIRTFTVTARQTDLGVGGGIVADSVADREWAETELKAHRLLAAAGAAARHDAQPDTETCP